MRYLNTYKLFESSEEDDIIQKLERDPLWVENDEKREHFEYDFRYDLGNGFHLEIIKTKDGSKLIAYLVDINDSFNYMDYVIDGYNRLYKYGYNPIERMIKIAKISSQIFTKVDLYPTEEDIVNIIFPEFKEDLGFNLREEKFGFVDTSFPKKDTGTIFYQSSYEQEVYFPCDHKSQDKPKKVFIFDQNDSDVTIEQLKQEFEDCKFRINELEFNLNCNLYITSTRYYNEKWRPVEFMIVLEEKK